MSISGYLWGISIQSIVAKIYSHTISITHSKTGNVKALSGVNNTKRDYTRIDNP